MENFGTIGDEGKTEQVGSGAEQAKTLPRPDVLRVPEQLSEALKRHAEDEHIRTGGTFSECLERVKLRVLTEGVRVLDGERGMSEFERARRIGDRVAKVYGLTWADLVSAQQTRSVVLPRHMAWYHAKNETQLSWEELGRVFERDHTTIMSGVARVRREVGTES